MAMVTVLLFLSVLSIIINILFIFVIKQRSDVTLTVKDFLYNLASANIIVCVFCFFWDLTTELNNVKGVWRCFLQYFGLQISLYATLGTVSMMNLERLVAIRSPYTYKHHFAATKRRLLLVAIWCTALICSLLTAEDFLHGINKNNMCTPLELYPRRYGLQVIGFVLLLYLSAQMIINIVLVHHLFRFSSHTTYYGAARAQRATGITLACSVSYIFTVTPIAAFELYCGITDEPLALVLVTPFSILANSMVCLVTVIDPIIYFISICFCTKGKRNRIGIARVDEAAASAVGNVNGNEDTTNTFRDNEIENHL